MGKFRHQSPSVERTRSNSIRARRLYKNHSVESARLLEGIVVDLLKAYWISFSFLRRPLSGLMARSSEGIVLS